MRNLFSTAKPAEANVAIGTGASSGTSNSGDTSSPPRQQQFKVGASVYDASHHGSCRGYGTVVGMSDLADDGMQKWKVKWMKDGTRITAIKETYLELPLIHSCHRVAPSGLNQPILVVLGMHKGKTGVTKKKVGMVVVVVAAGGRG